MRVDKAEAYASTAHDGEGKRNLPGSGAGAEAGSAAAGRTKPEALRLMEAAVERSNMLCAYERVVKNEGAPGVDGLTVAELKPWLQAHWAKIRQALLAGEYMPAAVRKVEIPKLQGGVRTLGIPTVVDRLIQQALHQVMQALFEPEFSESSYGFRPGRNAHQAVQAARSYVAEGKRWVVDVDLEKFFDRVNHDVLMARVARRVKDERVLKLIRRYLEAGLMEGGVTSARTEGTPQGGPLSPLLSNILLTDLDRELERRRHRFVRYADDCNIYVRSRGAGQRVMRSVTRFLTRRLKLKVNEAKSAVARPEERKFLGFSFSNNKETKRRISPKALLRCKQKIRELTRRTRGTSLEQMMKELAAYLRGWKSYFGFCQTPWILRNLDYWIRRRLRSVIWKQWKRSAARFRELRLRDIRVGLAAKTAGSAHGPWRLANSPALAVALPNAYFASLGLPYLFDGP